MKFKKLLSLLAVSALATGLLAGCGGEEKAADSNVVKVGVFLPLTGDNAAGGELELRGIKLANQLHPEVLGKKVELVVADNKSDKAEAASVAARLIEKDKVSAIVGSYGSSLSMAAGNIVKENKVPAVGTSCTNPQVTANNDYYFRACFIDPFQGKVMAEYAFQNGFKKVAIVQEVSNDYSVGLAKFFREEFVKLTGDENSIVDVANYQTGDKDFTAILTNLKAQNPDAVFAPGNFTESALLVKQARQLGITAQFMGGDTWETQEFIDVGGKDVEGVALGVERIAGRLKLPLYPDGKLPEAQIDILSAGKRCIDLLLDQSVGMDEGTFAYFASIFNDAAGNLLYIYCFQGFDVTPIVNGTVRHCLFAQPEGDGVQLFQPFFVYFFVHGDI